MSLKYRNQNGVETPVAGLNGTSGELVPSVSLYRKGTVTNATVITSKDYERIEVIFDTPMPDADYIVDLQTMQGNGLANAFCDAYGKTKNGFSIILANPSDNNVQANQIQVVWRAFKLMTDESRALDEQAIAALQAVVPSTATASNQLVPANGKVRGLNTGNWISDDFNNAVPSDNSSMQIFTVLNSATNSPGLGANYIVLTQVFSSGLIQQEAIQNGTNYRYIRNCDSGTWSAWSRIATEKECVLYKTVSSISDIRALAKNRSYFLTTTESFNVVDDGGTSYTIPAGAVSTPFHWSGGDTHIEFYYNYPVGSSHIWAVFLNSNGQNRGKQLF